MSKSCSTVLRARHRIVLLATLTLAACATAPARRPSSSGLSPANTLPIPLEMRTQVRNSEIIGRQLYILDKVSAIAVAS